MKPKLSSLCILLASTLWATIGIFFNLLSACGFSSWQTIQIRAFTAVIFLIAYVLIKNPKLFRIQIKDIWIFIITGFISFVAVNYLYIITIEQSTMSIAATLMYTSPFFVAIASHFFFKYRLTPVKIVALMLTLLGCALVSGITSGGNISLTCFFTGIGSGICYATYSIFGSIALKKYPGLTVTLYSILVACIGMFLVTPYFPFEKLLNTQAIIGSLGLGVISCMFPFLLYTIGLANTEPAKASVLATMEPVMATILGAIVYHEVITFSSAIGVILIVLSAVLMNNAKHSIIPKHFFHHDKHLYNR